MPGPSFCEFSGTCFLTRKTTSAKIRNVLSLKT